MVPFTERMKLRAVVALLPAATLLAMATPSPSLAQPMQPGQWTLAMRIDLDTGSEAAPPVGACVTQGDIDDPTRTLPRPGGRCVLTNVERTTERATYDLACMDGALQSKGKATVILRGDRYDGEAKMTYSERGGPPREMTVAITARRTGDCTR